MEEKDYRTLPVEEIAQTLIGDLENFQGALDDLLSSLNDDDKEHTEERREGDNRPKS